MTKFIIPEGIPEDLKNLLLNSISFDNKMKQKWFTRYPELNEEHRGKLKTILLNERTQLNNATTILNTKILLNNVD